MKLGIVDCLRCWFLLYHSEHEFDELMMISTNGVGVLEGYLIERMVHM